MIWRARVSAGPRAAECRLRRLPQLGEEKRPDSQHHRRGQSNLNMRGPSKSVGYCTTRGQSDERVPNVYDGAREQKQKQTLNVVQKLVG